jgi:hypothetical protein
MIGFWHALAPDPARRVRISLGARLGGYELIVERCGDEPGWRWAVLSQAGHEVEGGTAPNAQAAQRMAEEAAFHLHPPSTGDWMGRLT